MESGASEQSLRLNIIEPSKQYRGLDFRELWTYRSLVATLVARHLQVRYAQSVLGVGWSIVRPLISMVVFTIVFGQFARLPSDGHPYALFSLAAVVPWTYFSTALTSASESMAGSASMITKVYFPRFALPLAGVLAPLVDMAIGGILLLMMVTWFGLAPAWSSTWVIPLLIAVMMFTALGVGCFVAAVDVQYRDASRLVPFALQLWMYASPIVYPISMVPERYRPLYRLNPLVTTIETFRSILLGTPVLDWRSVGTALTTSLLICAMGAIYFRTRERIFADVV